MRKVTARELASFGLGVGHGDKITLSRESQVQLVKAKILNDLEEVFPPKHGFTEKHWLRALRKIEAKGIIKPGIFLDALRELISDLSKEAR